MVIQILASLLQTKGKCYRAVTKSWGPAISPTYYEYNPHLLSWEKKIKPKRLPGCSIPYLPVLSLNFTSAGKGSFLTGKAKNMHHRRTLLVEGGRLHLIHEGFYFRALKSILNTSKQRILRMKAAFAAKVNLIKQVTEILNFSCQSRKSIIGTEAHENIVSLQCLTQRNSSVYFFFPVFTSFSCEDRLGSQYVFYETTYLILVKLQAVAGGKKWKIFTA